MLQSLVNQTRNSQAINCRTSFILKENTNINEDLAKPSTDSDRGDQDASHIKNPSHGDIPTLQVSTSSGFAWAKRRKDDASRRSHCRSISRGHISNSLEHSSLNYSRNNFDTKNQENKEFSNSRGHQC